MKVLREIPLLRHILSYLSTVTKYNNISRKEERVVFKTVRSETEETLQGNQSFFILIRLLWTAVGLSVLCPVSFRFRPELEVNVNYSVKLIHLSRIQNNKNEGCIH